MNHLNEKLVIASRTILAVFGGYAAAQAIPLFLASMLPLPRVEATAIALMLSFAVHAAAAIWAFSARTATLAWVGLTIPSLISAGLWYWIQGGMQ
ncbi:DUF3649 domain-containing protein [Hwanghaeella sp. 1Z406]|jgi:hypothetical protein|uniref:DUF3649 domain-containing protein n=1 Tax=Hwanghaeella sp. 1Z406 TaxID=3402811 RepID=UPI003B6714C7|tara:strand:- start:2117 stop:2401 length:285 start_codon:yes stop_codon:yes gene_type:complete